MNSNDSKNSNGKKKKKKKTFVRYFVVSFVILFSMVFVAYAFTFLSQKTVPENNIGSGSSSGDSTSDKPSLMDTLFGTKQVKTNIAVFGTDADGTRTDVMFVGTFDSKTKKIGLLSIPRDTRVTMTTEMQTKIKESQAESKGGIIPTGYGKGICKINEIHAYAPKDQRNEYSVMQLEDLLSIKIDYYVKIDLVAFREIVDTFGGVDIDVPQNMYYSDPFQDLYINLKKGPQHLDGKMAEQLVRFRSYPEGDVARVEVQQLFMTEFMKKVLNTKNLIVNAPSLINTLFKYVETDIGVDDAIKYVKYLGDIKVENMTMETLPGEGQYVDEVSYFLHDANETRVVVDRLFYNTGDTESSTAIADNGEIMSSKDKKIEVLNGGSVGGIAGKTKDKLNSEGFNVASIGTYEGTRQEKTQIIVKEQGLGKDLQQYFLDSEVKVDSDELSNDTDIKIIIGTKER